MRNNQPVTHNEYPLPAGVALMSHTDAKGCITKANDAFVAVSGFTREELIGQPHNIVRHPDMPRGAFKLLWDTLKAEKEFFGYVKNMASNGDYYWVFANVTPDYDSRGNVVGYFSVRRKPKPSAVATMQSIYQEMLDVERNAGPANGPDASIAHVAGKLKSLGTTYDRFVLSL